MSRKLRVYNFLIQKLHLEWNYADRFLRLRKNSAEKMRTTFWSLYSNLNLEYNVFKGDGEHVKLDLTNNQKREEALQMMGNLSTSFCMKPSCESGYVRKLTQITNNTLSWKCVLCAKNTYKALRGDGECLKCMGRNSIDNGKRTACIDPYANRYINFSIPEFLVLMILNTFGLLLTLITSIVFIFKRKTPMVSVSDFKISMAHMSIIIVLFLALPSTFIGKPDFNKCITRLLSVSVLYVTSVGILFVKSQKLLQAFLSKVRITAEEARKTKWIQIFTMFVFLATANFLLGTSAYTRSIQTSWMLIGPT